MKLIRLDNGDWIDPRYVSSIRSARLSSSYVDSEVVPPRVIVTHRDGMMSIVELELHMDPVKAAEDLAVQINAERAD